MYAMPRKTFRSTAKALLAIPQTSVDGTRSARGSTASSSLPTSFSMTLPAASPHYLPPPSSCHSSPGNSRDDDDQDDEFRRASTTTPQQRLSVVVAADASSSSPARRGASLAAAAVVDGRRSWRQLVRSKQHSALVRTVTGLLHDNRALSSRHPDTARRLRQLNAEARADTSCRALKFVLNALLIAIGLMLLLSVLAAIAYTSTGQYTALLLCTAPSGLTTAPANPAMQGALEVLGARVPTFTPSTTKMLIVFMQLPLTFDSIKLYSTFVKFDRSEVRIPLPYFAAFADCSEFVVTPLHAPRLYDVALSDAASRPSICRLPEVAKTTRKPLLHKHSLGGCAIGIGLGPYTPGGA